MEIKTCSFVKSIANFQQKPEKKLPEFAFIGRSNVGKSSLINTLLNRKKLVKVSNTPGKTRLINFFEINKSCYFVDLPGYGYARASKVDKNSWAKNIGEYLQYSEELKMLFLLIDARHGIKEIDQKMLWFLHEYLIKYQVLATKRDKLSGNEWVKKRNLLSIQINMGKESLISFSSISKEGRESVLNIIGKELEIS